MTKQTKGTSELALLVDRVPLRDRIGLALVAVDLAVGHLEPSHNFFLACGAFDLGRRWYDDEYFDPARFDHALAHAYQKELARSEMEAESAAEESAWLVLKAALLYIALQADRTLGRCPSPLAWKVDESILDEVDKGLRALSPALANVIVFGAQCLKRDS
jgi:hypothetical protein